MKFYGININNYTALITIVITTFAALLILRSGYILDGDYALYIAQAKHILSGTQHHRESMLLWGMLMTAMISHI